MVSESKKKRIEAAQQKARERRARQIAFAKGKTWVVYDKSGEVKEVSPAVQAELEAQGLTKEALTKRYISQGMTTREGYILSTGEITRSKARVAADVGKISYWKEPIEYDIAQAKRSKEYTYLDPTWKERTKESTLPATKPVRRITPPKPLSLIPESYKPKRVQETITLKPTLTTKEIRKIKPLPPHTSMFSPTKLPSYIEKKESEIRFQKTPSVKAGFIGLGLTGYQAVKTVGYDVPKSFFSISKDIGTAVVTGKRTPTTEFLAATVTKPKQTISALQTSISTSFQKTPSKALGTTAGLMAFPFVESKVARMARSTLVKVGSKKIAPEKVFSPQVLEKGQMFPTTKSLKESITRFKATKTPEGQLLGTHVTTTSFTRKTTLAKGGTPSIKHLQDQGLYITPFKEGSPHFLGLKSAGLADSSFSLVPFKEFFKKPSVINIEFKTIQRIPKELIKTKGFKQSNIWLQSQAGKQTAFITKRSEIGQEGLKGLGAGTSEIEAVLPAGTKIKIQPSKTLWGRIKGYEKYTTHEGFNIPIKEYQTTKGIVGIADFAKISTSISKQSSSLSRYLSESRIVVTPAPAISSLISSFRPSRVSALKPTSSRSFQTSRSSSFATSKASSGLTSVKPSKSSFLSPTRPSKPISTISKISKPRTQSFLSLTMISKPTKSYRPYRPSPLTTPTPRITTKFQFPETKGAKKKRKKKLLMIRQPRGFKPSLFATTLSLKGKPTKLGITTGLGIRPMRGL